MGVGDNRRSVFGDDDRGGLLVASGLLWYAAARPKRRSPSRRAGAVGGPPDDAEDDPLNDWTEAEPRGGGQAAAFSDRLFGNEPMHADSPIAPSSVRSPSVPGAEPAGGSAATGGRGASARGPLRTAARLAAALLLLVGVLPWVAGRRTAEPPVPTRTPALTVAERGPVPAAAAAPSSCPAPASGRVPIESLVCGDAVLADAHGEADFALGETVDPQTWGRMRLRAPKTDGTTAEVEMLRPLSWMEERGVREGGTTHIAVPECGIDGEAEVLAVGPCPPVRECPPGYATVTATFRHAAANVLDLAIEGESRPLGTTGNHPVWSEDRREFVRADTLTVGERLLNEAGETVRVTAASPRGPPEPVFNLEVHGQHVYRVGDGGLLVHNGGPCDDIILGLKKWDDEFGGWNLEKMSQRLGGAWNEQWRAKGLIGSNHKRFQDAFWEATGNTLERGGRIKFMLDDFDVDEALRLKLGPNMNLGDVGYTNWELATILHDRNLLGSTDFYLGGQKIDPGWVYEFGLLYRGPQ